MANLGNSFTPGYSSMTSLGVVYKRLNPNPLDASTIFWSLADATAYAKGDGSDERKLGATSYVGQIITVYEKGAVSVYKIEEDRSLASIGGTDTLEVDYYENLANLTKLKVGQLVKVKFVKEGDSHKAGFYIYNGTDFDHLSVSTGATDEVGELKSKVSTLDTKVTDIADDIYVIDGETTNLVFYTKGEVDDKFTNSGYVTGTQLSTELTNNHYTKTEVDNALAGKVNNGTFESFQSNVESNYATNTALNTGLAGKADKDHNHDSAYASLSEFNAVKETVDSLPSNYSIKAVTPQEGFSTAYQLWYTVGTESKPVEGAATINIPKDMVVSGGEVVTDPEGQEPGTYIKLTLANATNDVLYIPATKLVDTYTGDSYISVSGYTLSLNVSTLATQLASEQALKNAFVEKTEFNLFKESNTTAYQQYADTAAGNAQTAATGYVDKQLKGYVQTATLNNYVTSETYNGKVGEIDGKLGSINASIEGINATLSDEASGNAALKTAIDNAVVELGKANEAVGKNTQDISGLSLSLQTLDSAVVKTISLGGTDYTPTDGKVTISLVDTITDEVETGIPSVKAVKDAISVINTNIDNRTTISVVDALPAEGKENVIYILNTEGKKSEHIFIGNASYQLGSDTYARKDVMAAGYTYAENGDVMNYGHAGLMTAVDKTKLDSIVSITTSELGTILAS
jgi:hypothetical protein